MKKHIIIILLASLLLLCACQPTPETEVVVNKAEGRLDELIVDSGPQPLYQTDPTAENNTPIPGNATETQFAVSTRQPGKTLKSTIDAPVRIEDSFSGNAIGDTLTVDLDADVDVPNISRVPVFTVRIEVPIGEKRDAMFRFLLGGQPYYQPVEEEKLQIGNMIRYLNNYVLALEDKPYGDNAPYETMIQSNLADIQALSLQIASLPEHMEFTEAAFDPTKRSVELMNKNHVLVRQMQDAQGSAVIQYVDCERSVNVFTATGMRAPRNEQEQAALNAAEEFINGVGLTDTKAIGMVCADEDRRLYWNTEHGVEDGIYRVSLVPLYAGIPCYSYSTYYGSDTGRHSAKADPEYAWYPPQETIYAIVQDQAVTQFVWQYPCEIVTMDNANVSLLSFDEIMKIFQKQIFMNVYLDKGFPETMHITDIRFSYLRMKKLNSEEFYLLPVWDFLGYCTDEDADDPLSRSWYDNQSFLTINAIDGSIIDRNVGY